MTMEAPEVDDKVKFMLGYESDHELPADSGVSTENTSLDRSPDVEKENLVENRVQASVDSEISQPESNFEETLRLEPSSSLISISSDEENPLSPNSNVEAKLNRKLKEEARKVLNDWGMPMPENEEFRSIDDVIAVLRKQRREKKISEQEKAAPKESTSQQSSSRRKDPRRKSTSKNKRKKSKMFMVILESQNTQNQNSVRLDLDHFVDEGSAALDITECADDEQIALALQAQELAARQQARGKFKSSEDLIHRLFVCIAGVADQLQTNFAADLRNILKAVFLMNQTPDELDEPIEEKEKEKSPTIEYEVSEDQVIQNGSSFDSVYSAEEVYADSNSDSNQSESSRLSRRNTVNSTTISEEPSPDVRVEVRRKSIDNVANLQGSVSTGDLTLDRDERRESTVERAPEWVPDIAAPACMRCEAHFTAFRRRHHCGNCGKVFCASCSSNSCPLPRYGQLKPVRVCEGCFASIAINCRRQTTR